MKKMPDMEPAEVRRRRESAIAMRAGGATRAEIAAALGISVSRAHGLTAGIGGDDRPAANAARAAIRPAWLDHAEQLAAAGLNRLEIARALGVAKSVVYRRLPNRAGRP
jgi:DNA-binding CsgD family transcriptional regulator